MQNEDLTRGEYRRKAVEAGITGVVEQDKKPLKDYLTRKIETCEQIDQNAVIAYQQKEQQEAFKQQQLVQESERNTRQVPQLSSSELLEQHEKHAALIDQATHKSRILSITQSESGADQKANVWRTDLKNLRKSKKRRQSEAEGEIDGEDMTKDLEDKAFLENDAENLKKQRIGEVPSVTRSTVLCTKNMNFDIVIDLYNRKILSKYFDKNRPIHQKHQQMSSSSKHQSSHDHGHSSNPEKNKTKDKSSQHRRSSSASGVKNDHSNSNSNRAPQRVELSPIIIVPNALTSDIGTINAKDLLLKGIYHSVEDMRKSGQPMANEIRISRRMPDGREKQYKIINDASKLPKEGWDRVCAVFVTGQPWQFKNWRYNNSVDLFQQALGVYINLDGKVISPTIKSWNCSVLKTSSSNQTVNIGSMKSFWLKVDEFIKLKKPVLQNRNRQ